MGSQTFRLWTSIWHSCHRVNPLRHDAWKLGGRGSKGAHWERTMVYDELMTASRLGPSKTFSGLTFALLKDTGFYFVDDSNAETLQWGYQ